MEEMIRTLSPLPRDIISDGYDEALFQLATQVPMAIHEYPTGSECFTWIVPEKWTCREAYLETLDGERVFSYADNPLHVVSYSLPFDDEISREELFRHLHTHSYHDDAIPFIFKYYERDWGLCCSKQQKASLKDDRYRVVIESAFSPGTLKVGEVVAKGKTDKNIVLCAHLCHPCMANDDMSGVAVGIDIMRELISRSDLNYTYRLIIVPETIGSAAFLSHHRTLIPEMVGGIFLEMLGTPHPHSLQLSFGGSSQFDKCAKMVVLSHDSKAWVGKFPDVILNDERMFNAPGVRVPMVSLSRVLKKDHPDYPYREYHSSLDTFESVNIDHLYKSRDVVIKLIDMIDNNYIPVPKFEGELFCSRYKKIDYSRMEETMLKTIYSLGEGLTLLDICEQSGLEYQVVKEFMDILFAEGLIEKTTVQ